MAAALRTTDAGDFAIGPAHTSTPTITTKSIQTVQGPVFGIPPKLEQYVLLAKSARGAGVANLIGRAIGAPGVYVFSELLDVPTIRDLKNHELYNKDYELLEIFAFGTWSDYIAKRDRLPKLTPAQETKLRHLTILSLAMSDRIIPYSILLSSLELTSIPILEDLLIEGFYNNLLTGRLDQRFERLEVITTTGRDVRSTSTSTSDEGRIIEVENGEGVEGNSMEVDGVLSSSSTTTTTPTSNSDIINYNTSHSILTLTQNLQEFQSTISNLLTSLFQNLAILHAKAINDTKLELEQNKLISSLVLEVKEKQNSSSSASNSNNNNNSNGGGGGNPIVQQGGGGGSSWEDSPFSPSSNTGGGKKLGGSSTSTGISNLLGVPGGGEDMDVDNPSTTSGAGGNAKSSTTTTGMGGTASRQKKRRM